MSSLETLPIRKTARVVLINDANQCLLIKIKSNNPLEQNKLLKEGMWITPGGKIEEGELQEEAARRELYEETGIDQKVGPLIWFGKHVVNWGGTQTLLEESFFLAKTLSREINTVNLEEGEQEVYKETKWWSLEEIHSTSEYIVPGGLILHINDVIENKIEKIPIEIDMSVLKKSLMDRSFQESCITTELQNTEPNVETEVEEVKLSSLETNEPSS
ncbi:NUDIX hydrolase [Candidatus Phycorickettsia trachydisci]|nr:NUDIX domain-containing protein [Candidatus Phycorickettsia trachydisci]